jgi:hypothetical protein
MTESMLLIDTGALIRLYTLVDRRLEYAMRPLEAFPAARCQILRACVRCGERQRVSAWYVMVHGIPTSQRGSAVYSATLPSSNTVSSCDCVFTVLTFGS